MTALQARRWRLGLAVLASAVLTATAGAWDGREPRGVFVTWFGDPASTMTIRWLAPAAPEGDPDAPEGAFASRVVYGTRSGPVSIAEGTREPFQETGLDLHTVELRGLQPGAEHRFVIEGSPLERVFRTMPVELTERTRFVVGGDVYQQDQIDDRMYRAAAAIDPAFVVLGGDIVYDDGDPARAGRWVQWLEAWSRLMVGAGGRMIPVMAVIGNHELPPVGMNRTPAEAPLYYQVFAEPGFPSYRVLDFGKTLSIFLLDSGHTEPIGAQAAWLDRRLAARGDVAHKVAVYHVPAWPSVRGLDEWTSPQVRRDWVPIFERFGVDVAYEHHDHAYKRTHRIRGGRVDPAGVLYIGDGAWGVPTRAVHEVKGTWYLARAEAINHFIVTTIEGGRMSHQAIGVDGRVIDRFE